MHIRTAFRHRSFSSRASSTSLSDLEDDDAITPVDECCPHASAVSAAITAASISANRQSMPPVASVPHATKEQRSLSSQPCSSSGYDSDDAFENAHLWRRMLALQRRYHCYNSARMSAALEDENVEAIVPPRACLDLLNDSMSTAWLCEEARAEAAELLVLVPDRIRSRKGSYGELVEGLPSSFAAPLPMLAAMPATTAAGLGSKRPASLSGRSRQDRLKRRRLWRRQHDE